MYWKTSTDGIDEEGILLAIQGTVGEEILMKVVILMLKPRLIAPRAL